jgi:tetrahydromethanopterin S-methyltransferase subunit G
MPCCPCKPKGDKGLEERMAALEARVADMDESVSEEMRDGWARDGKVTDRLDSLEAKVAAVQRCVKGDKQDRGLKGEVDGLCRQAGGHGNSIYDLDNKVCSLAGEVSAAIEEDRARLDSLEAKVERCRDVNAPMICLRSALGGRQEHPDLFVHLDVAARIRQLIEKSHEGRVIQVAKEPPGRTPESKVDVGFWPGFVIGALMAAIVAVGLLGILLPGGAA